MENAPLDKLGVVHKTMFVAAATLDKPKDQRLRPHEDLLLKS